MAVWTIDSMDYSQLSACSRQQFTYLAAILITWLANNSRLKVLETKLDNLNLRMDRLESRMDWLEFKIDKLDDRVRSLVLFNAGSGNLIGS